MYYYYKVEYKFLSHIKTTNIFEFQFPLFWIFCRLGFCRFVCSILQISIYAWAEENGEGDKIVKYFLFSLRLESDSNQILCKPDQRTEGWQPSMRTRENVQTLENSNPWCSHLVYFCCSPNILTDLVLENHWLVSHFTIPIWNKWFYQISQVISSSLINFSHHQRIFAYWQTRRKSIITPITASAVYKCPSSVIRVVIEDWCIGMSSKKRARSDVSEIPGQWCGGV